MVCALSFDAFECRFVSSRSSASSELDEVSSLLRAAVLGWYLLGCIVIEKGKEFGVALTALCGAWRRGCGLVLSVMKFRSLGSICMLLLAASCGVWRFSTSHFATWLSQPRAVVCVLSFDAFVCRYASSRSSASSDCDEVCSLHRAAVFGKYLVGCIVNEKGKEFGVVLTASCGVWTRGCGLRSLLSEAFGGLSRARVLICIGRLQLGAGLFGAGASVRLD